MILVGILALRLAPWGWRAALDRAEEFRSRAELLARARATVDAASTLQDSSVATEAKLVALAPKILAAGQEAEAVADLGGRLNVLASAHRVRLSRTDPIGDSTRAGKLRRVSVRVALEGDSRGTLGFLGGLAAEPAVLVLQDLRIMAPNAAATSTVPEVLETEATVLAWYLARESSP